MRIHTDHNGVHVNAISSTAGGKNVEGHLYQLQAGPNSSTISFQQGGVAGSGVNGITSESLIAILIHRIKFLNDQLPCPENARALNHLDEALINLEVRTARRMVRGVEGREVA